MLDPARIAEIADELTAADRDRTTVPLLTARNPGMTVEDAYSVQRLWADRAIASGRRLVGRKIGLTSKVMQVATGITHEQTAVFGDYLNDLEMMDAAALSFAMANAHPDIAARARFGAPSNLDHGVITTIEKLLDGVPDAVA